MSDPDLTNPRNPYLPAPPARSGAPDSDAQGGPAPTQPLHPFPATPTAAPPYAPPFSQPTAPLPWGQPSLPQPVSPTYAAAPGGPHPYGPHGVPWGPPPDHPQSTTALVLGVVAIMGFLPAGPFAWVLGSRARRAIDADPTRYGGRGLATAGYALGIVTSVMLLLLVGLFALLVAVAVAGV